MPNFRLAIIIVLLTMTTLSCAMGEDSPAAPVQSPSVPSPLFNGEDFSGWFFDAEDVDISQVITYTDSGTLLFSGEPVGALLTENEYTDYVLHLQWRWPEGEGNSGVLIHATGSRVAGPWPRCLEPQLKSGDAGDFHGIGGFAYHADHKDDPQNGGRAMNLTDDSENETGQWNTMVVRCEASTVTVYINGILVNQCHDTEVSAGRIGLQSEGSPIEFRDIKIEPLVITPTDTINLFDGESLEGWTSDLNNQAAMTDVFDVEDGVLKDTGRPAGVIRTIREYRDYEIEVQWRWPNQGGNSGLLLHCAEPRRMGPWPTSLEVQLGAGNAGDFWRIGLGVSVSDQQQTQGRRTINLTDNSENAIGEWNTMIVHCEGDRLTVHVNGDKVNEGWDIESDHGAICLQAEGTPIEFRKVELRPVD